MEKGVNTSEATWGTLHAIICWSQAIYKLIPRCRTWKNDLDDDTNEVHITECTCPQMKGVFWAEKPQENGNNEREGEVNDTVWKPSEDVEDRVCKTGEDVGDVGAI